MRFLSAILLFLFTCLAHAADPVADKPSLFVLVGAAGEAEFGKQFADAAAKWAKVADAAQAKLVAIGWKGVETNDLARLQAALEAEAKEAPAKCGWCCSATALSMARKRASTCAGRT